MAITLNLVKSRLISSHDELSIFKKEATASLLKFAESNTCDLDAISRLLTAKYAEITAALNDGYAVESEVEIQPQEATPPAAAAAPVTDLSASGLTPKQLNRADIGQFSSKFEDMARKYQLTPDLHSWMVSREGESLDLGNVACSAIEAEMAQFAKKFGLASDKKQKKTACLQRVAEPLHPALPAPTIPAEGGISTDVTQDPMDLAIAEQDRLAAEPPLPEGGAPAPEPEVAAEASETPVLTEEDIAALLDGNPERQETAGKIVGASIHLGRNLAWQLLCRVATGSYNAAQLKELHAALRVVAAGEGEIVEQPEAPENVAEEHAGEAVPSLGAKPEVAPEAAPAAAAAKGPESDLLAKFNALMASVDKDENLLLQIKPEDITQEQSLATRRDRPAPDNAPHIVNPETNPESFTGTHGPVLPWFNGLADDEQQAILADQNTDDEVYTALAAWYMEQAGDIDSDMAAGVDEAIKGKPEAEGISGEQIITYLHADPANNKIITYDDIPRIIGEIKKEQGAAGKSEEAPAKEEPAAEKPAEEKPAEEPAKEPAKEEKAEEKPEGDSEDK
jgi:hypothetical protein